jgi:hypothetical protein
MSGTRVTTFHYAMSWSIRSDTEIYHTEVLQAVLRLPTLRLSDTPTLRLSETCPTTTTPQSHQPTAATTLLYSIPYTLDFPCALLRTENITEDSLGRGIAGKSTGKERRERLAPRHATPRLESTTDFFRGSETDSGAVARKRIPWLGSGIVGES